MPALLDLVDHEKLISMSVGRRAAWVLANTGRCWFRTGINQENYPSTVVATKTSIPRVNHWVAIPGRLKVLQSSPNDEVNYALFYSLVVWEVDYTSGHCLVLNLSIY
ncbi:unnamed protein product [Dibothriocephalus latus]|uniref:Uncharacterized protein n=1 Tax=Dibothriocephalus latus TaxID=60516 RepID=A0A3P7LA46_DIBLA|nr:unnamed protein product [Dibothriocephalus latus]